nr:hypothetical protein [Tanacetum cinerariifolium]
MDNKGIYNFVQLNKGVRIRLQALVTGRPYHRVGGSPEEASWEWMSDSHTSWVADVGRTKRLTCYVQGSGRRKKKNKVDRGSERRDCALFGALVKDNKEKDKIRTKSDKIKSKREAWKSPDSSPIKSKPSQSQESIKSLLGFISSPAFSKDKPRWENDPGKLGTAPDLIESDQSSNPTSSTNPNLKGRNHRRSKQRIVNSNIEEHSHPVVTMADQRTMAQLLQAPTEGYEDAIVIPAIAADNFELKHGLLTLIQNKQFYGHDKEDPHAHIHYFNKITSTLKFLNVPNTLIKLMLFPFSLKGAARIWLEKEPPRSIFTWDDLVSKFINQFFPLSKTTSLQLHQLDTFYNALNSKDQDSLNSTVGGNFLDKMPCDCLSIIESKSKVRYSRDKPIVAKVSMNASTSGVSPDVAELKDMPPMATFIVTIFKNLYLKPPQLITTKEIPAINHFIPNQNRGKNFNQGPVYQPSVFQQPAYQAPAYQALAPQTQGVSKEDFLAYVKANDAVMKNMQTQGQNMQNQLTNLTDLIMKFVNSNSASTSSSGTLPSNTNANPKSDLKAITTRSGMAECLSLVDIDASINLIPFSMWKRLSLPDLIPTCMTLELADRSISRPVGVAEDVYIKTRRALIDVFEGVLTLRVGKKAITFNMDQTSRYYANYSNMTAKRIDVIDIAYEPTLSKFHQSYLDPEGDILLLEAFLNDDPSSLPPNQRNNLPEVRKELKICEAKSEKSSVDEPPVVELKALPPHLEYAFLEGDDKLPVIIANEEF